MIEEQEGNRLVVGINDIDDRFVRKRKFFIVTLMSLWSDITIVRKKTQMAESR